MKIDIARLSARAAVCSALKDAPDDMLIDTETYALLRDTTANTIRQEIHHGKLAVTKIGRRALLRLGDARQSRRGGDATGN